MRLVVGVLMGMGVLAWSMPSAGQASRQPEVGSVEGQATVRVDDGKLSVALKEARFREVLEAIARQAGIQVSFLGEVGQATLTVSFVGLPLEDGLRRLLRGTDHAFVYTGTGAARRISQVFVLSGAADQPKTVAAETGGEPGVGVAAVIREAVDTQRFADAVQAAIVAEGGDDAGV